MLRWAYEDGILSVLLVIGGRGNFEGLGNGTIKMTEWVATDLSAFNDKWSVFSLPYLWENG